MVCVRVPIQLLKASEPDQHYQVKPLCFIGTRQVKIFFGWLDQALRARKSRSSIAYFSLLE